MPVREEEPSPPLALWCQVPGIALVLKLYIFNQPGTEGVTRLVSALFYTPFEPVPGARLLDTIPRSLLSC